LDRDLSYPGNVPFFITTRRFGGVGAQEGREKVSDHIFLEIKKVVFLAEGYGINQIFLQNCVSGGRLRMQLEPKYSAEFVLMG
jgi:hypothetical protein